jgi:hypothetical protein
MNFGFKLRYKWWYSIAIFGGTLYEAYRWLTFRPITDAETERMAMWIMKHAVIVDVTGL